MPQNVGSIRDLTAKIYTEFCKADRSTLKLTLQDINTTPKEPKTERGRSRRQLFRPFWGSSRKVNFHVVRSALQNSVFLLSVFAWFCPCF